MLTRADLARLGFSAMAIEHRLATGRLHLISRGIYAVGRRELTPHGRWTAAVLVCGEGAALSHRSAAELWGIGHEEPGRIDVSTIRRRKIRRRGLKVRSRLSLPDRNIVRRHGIPVTNVVQTLVDVATELKPLRLERSVNEADKLDLVDPEALRACLDAYAGMPGARTLRTLLDRHTFRLSDSDLEIFFRPLALAAGLPVPLTKHWVLGYETDFFFPDHGLVVEADGLRYHRTPSQQARMARRDQKHAAAGLRVLRFTHWQIAYAPNEVTEVLRQIRRHLAAPKPPPPRAAARAPAAPRPPSGRTPAGRASRG